MGVGTRGRSSFTTQASEYGAEWPVSRAGATRDATIYDVTMLAREREREREREKERFPRHAAASWPECPFRHLTA